MNKKTILEVCAKLNIGGAQTVAANVANYADNRYLFHYVVFGDDVGEYEQQIIAGGNKIFHFESPQKNIVSYFFRLIKLMKSERYDAVHCHTMFNCGIVMLAAKIARIPCRISHSHTTNPEQQKTPLHAVYRFLMRALIRCCGNEFIACGVNAGETLYGKEWFHKNGLVIPNGIDVCAYRFTEKARAAIRTHYHVEQNFVIGHVGHYVAVKNQKFLITLMPEILKQQPNAVLMLFGDGGDRPILKNEILQLGLQKHVRLMGNVRNIHEVLSAMDVFAFPSLFEGTPLALIEAQANGLPCVISDSVPYDACLTDDVTRIPLTAPKADWIEALTSARRNHASSKPELVLTKYEDVKASMNRIYNVFNKYR